MPLVRIAVPTGKTAEYQKAISEGIQLALAETFDVPKDDLFHIITEHAAGIGIVRPSSYLEIAYSNDLILIQITANDTRTLEQKKQLFNRIAEHLSASPGLRQEDIFVNLV